MKNMRIPILSALGVAIIGIIIGTFCDYQISSSIASATSVFGLTVSVIGPTIGFSGLAFVGGGMAALGTKEKKMWAKILFFAASAIAEFVTVYYAGREYFGINGFYQYENLTFVGLLIAAICGGAAEVGGFYVFKNSKIEDSWLPFVLVYAVLLLVLIAAIPILKDTMHRPRYRTVLDQSLVPFHRWYQRCANYKEYMTINNISGEEFKSFPSGHTGEAAILIVIAAFAPLANDKIKKYQLPLFICACVFVAFVGLGRICAAAHYLSDVSMGAALTLIFTCIANEVLIFVNKKKEAKPASQEPAEEVKEAPVEEEVKEEAKAE